MASRPDAYYEQSAVIPYRRTDERLEVLLVTTSSGKRWIVPKGIVETHLGPRKSAEQEAVEEAGVRGKSHPAPLGHYTFYKWGGVCRVEVYAMLVTEVLDQWPEALVRERMWVPVEKVERHVEQEGLRDLIAGLPTFLEARDGVN